MTALLTVRFSKACISTNANRLPLSFILAMKKRIVTFFLYTTPVFFLGGGCFFFVFVFVFCFCFVFARILRSNALSFGTTKQGVNKKKEVEKRKKKKKKQFRLGDIYSALLSYKKSARRVTVINVGNGLGDLSSTSKQGSSYNK